MHISVILAALLLFTAVEAKAATIHVISGKAVKLHFAYSINPDCTPVGEVTARVTQSPQQGRISVARVQDFPHFPSTNIRSVCNRRRVTGTMIQYVSPRGFIGSDYVGIEIFYPSGSLRQESFTIDVR